MKIRISDYTSIDCVSSMVIVVIVFLRSLGGSGGGDVGDAVDAEDGWDPASVQQIANTLTSIACMSVLITS